MIRLMADPYIAVTGFSWGGLLIQILHRAQKCLPLMYSTVSNLHPVAAFYYACQQDYGKTTGQIFMKLGGMV